MNQSERRQFLIKTLIAEQPRYRDIESPENKEEQKALLRSLMNVRLPGEISDEFLARVREQKASQTATPTAPSPNMCTSHLRRKNLNVYLV